jgi:hypothetical protein
MSNQEVEELSEKVGFQAKGAEPEPCSAVEEPVVKARLQDVKEVEEEVDVISLTDKALKKAEEYLL